MRRIPRFLRLLTALMLLAFCICSCTDKPSDPGAPLPDGGYDYRVRDGVLLGYPIPRRGANPYLLTEADAPAAFRIGTKGNGPAFGKLSVVSVTLPAEAGGVSVPAVSFGDGLLYFSYGSGIVTVSEGAPGGCAAVLNGESLYLADTENARLLSSSCRCVCDVWEDGILYLTADGMPHLYDAETGKSETPVPADAGVTDGWFVRFPEERVPEERVPAETDGEPVLVLLTEDGNALLLTRGGELCPSALSVPSSDRICFLRGTAFALCGTDDACRLYSLKSGDALPVDLGGLYRFQNGSDTLPLSPSGEYVFFSDIDMIYRVSLANGALSLSPNEAPIFEGRCILSSVTPASGDFVLLSQAENEYTEYVPVITPVRFQEDTPDPGDRDDGGFRP